MSKFYWKGKLEHKLRIFEIVILNTKWRLRIPHKLVYEKFYLHKKILCTRNCLKIYQKFTEKPKENI